MEWADGGKEWWINGRWESVTGGKEWWVNGERHREDGPAIEMAEGTKVWFVNGVKVPEWLVTTPSCDIDPKELFKIRNAQVRSEFVKKVGINRILTAFKAQIIESTGIYELLILQIGKRKRPYLRMQNPSTGEYHIEGVRPRCTTIKEALNYRNGLRKDQIDEINGEYMYQQGDVVLKPVGAKKKFKSVPRILT